MGELTVVKHLVSEHQTTKKHSKTVKESLTELEAVSLLRKAHAEWIPGRMESAEEKQGKLNQLMIELEEGLMNHYDFEERVLPPILGELLSEAIALEHLELREQMNAVKSAIAGIVLKGLDREDLLAKEHHVQQMIESLRQRTEEHLAKEEAILRMAQSALEETA